MMEKQGQERREFKRAKASFIVLYKVNTPLEIRMQVGNREIDAVIQDLSETGMAILTNYEIPASTIVSIKFNMIGDFISKTREKARSITAEGAICNCVFVKEQKAYRLGMHFTNMSASQREFIADFIKMSSS